MGRKPIIGVLGFSDGEPEVHEQLKGFVQNQVDALVNALLATAKVEVVVGDRLINSVVTAKEEALKMVSKELTQPSSLMEFSVSPIFRPLPQKTARVHLCWWHRLTRIGQAWWRC